MIHKIEGKIKNDEFDRQNFLWDIIHLNLNVYLHDASYDVDELVFESVRNSILDVGHYLFEDDVMKTYNLEEQ